MNGNLLIQNVGWIRHRSPPCEGEPVTSLSKAEENVKKRITSLFLEIRSFLGYTSSVCPVQDSRREFAMRPCIPKTLHMQYMLRIISWEGSLFSQHHKKGKGELL